MKLERYMRTGAIYSSLLLSVENKESPLSIGRCHAKGRGRRVWMSSSGNKETGEHPGSLQGHA
jgi:cation transport regulator ChaC